MLQEFNTFPNLKLSERQRLPECSSIYFATARDQVLYIGLAKNLRNRWQNHHRLPQLEAINKRCEVRLFWLGCGQDQLSDLERNYIEYYCPTLNQTKVPERQIIPSFQLLTLSLQKLSDRVIGFGICPSENKRLKTLTLFYLADGREIRLATTNLRKTLQAITRKPNSLFRWTEFERLKDGARWRTRCNGIEIQLIPWFGEHLIHNPSMYGVLFEKRFGSRNSISLTEDKTIREEIKAMPFRERLELARNSKIGQNLFPLECGAEFRTISRVEILCLTSSQIQTVFSKHGRLQDQYANICPIESDPVPMLEF